MSQRINTPAPACRADACSQVREPCHCPAACNVPEDGTRTVIRTDTHRSVLGTLVATRGTADGPYADHYAHHWHLAGNHPPADTPEPDGIGMALVVLCLAVLAFVIFLTYLPDALI